MLIKRLNPTETHLDFADMHVPLMSNSKKEYRLLDQKKTQAAMQATYGTSDDLNNIFEHRQDVALLHDLRFSGSGGQLHIDHLFITDNFHVFIVESRTAAKKLIFEQDNQVITTDKRDESCMIPSPLRQLKHNRSILKRAFPRIAPPTRFGRQLTPTFHQYILVDDGAIVTNRKDGDTNLFITRDELVALIDAQTRRKSLLSFFGRMPTKRLRHIARQIANMHLPREIRFANKFQHVVVSNPEQQLSELRQKVAH